MDGEWLGEWSKKECCLDCILIKILFCAVTLTSCDWMSCTVLCGDKERFGNMTLNETR